MTQVLRGSFNQDSFPTTPAALATQSSNLSTGLRPPPTFGINPTVQGFNTTPTNTGNTTTSTTINGDIINKLFN